MTDVKTYAWLCLLFPLAGMLLNSFGYRLMRGTAAGWLATLALLGSFVSAVLCLLALEHLAAEERQVRAVAWNLATTAGLDAQLALLVDPLSVFMATTISGVSFLIHLYSVAYMQSDRGYVRFFALLNFFVFSMLLLILAGNFLLLIVGWAFVGAASYLLISFWYRRSTATSAGIKAFVINVLGDVGLVLGTYFIFQGTGTLDFLGTFERVEEAFPTRNDGDLVAGCLLLLVGAYAKSAQIPLHTWLADAMEGPTPVSALIHAATMVTAGVYLIARMWPLFEQAPAAADVGAIIACATLVVAATTALAVTDLKRVIAYSTMSQIGYMAMGVASGAYAAGIFHFMTHAFFKALLFMAAGSVIGAMAGAQSLDRMSGFRRALPFTFGCFVVGGLALSSVPPFAGFFSKDEILGLVAERGGFHVVLAVVGYAGTFLTAVYTFRMIFRTFLGEPSPEAREVMGGHLPHGEHRNPITGEEEDVDVGFPGSEHHTAEGSWQMKVAMGVLAVLAVVGGFLQVPTVTEVVHHFLEPTFEESRFYDALEPTEGSILLGLLVGALLALAGVATAYVVWVRRPGTATALRTRFSALHALFVNKWYFDELIDWLVVRPARGIGAFAAAVVERFAIQGLLNDGTSGAVRAGSAAVRAAQTGYLRYYAALLILGMVAITAYFLVAA
jgi:NADH-quinone oxidoreductase subunit L